jgi:hypothetical protein
LFNLPYPYPLTQVLAACSVQLVASHLQNLHFQISLPYQIDTHTHAHSTRTNRGPSILHSWGCRIMSQKRCLYHKVRPPVRQIICEDASRFDGHHWRKLGNFAQRLPRISPFIFHAGQAMVAFCAVHLSTLELYRRSRRTGW